MTVGDWYEDVSPGMSPELEDEGVLVVREPDGSTSVVPASLRRAGPEGRRLATAALRKAAEVQKAQAELAELVAEMREEGLSWSVVGWATGLTSEGSRRRWGSEELED